MLNPINENQELSREWKRLIEFARELQFGEMTVSIRDGKPVYAEMIKQTIRFDGPSVEKRFDTRVSQEV